MANIPGVGPDAPMIVNELGAKQSDSPYLPGMPRAILHVYGIHATGSKKYGRDNWKGLNVEDHVHHAHIHLLAWEAGDYSDDHIGHAACRMLMALEMILES